MITCNLHRSDLSQPWGFRLTGGQEFNQPIIVQRVTPGSVASEYVQVGDVIVAIDDQDVSNVSHTVAMETIKKAGESMALVINRNEDYNDEYNQTNSALTSPEVNYYQNNPPPLGALPKHDYRAEHPPPPVKNQMPDQVLNMASRSDPTRKPFAYVADVHDIQQQREKVKRNRAQVSVPHYQNMLNMPNFEDPVQAGSRQDQNTNSSLPPGAVVQNLQFNSPLQMYSTENVVDALKGQTGGDISGVVGLKQKDKSDFTQSAVYKMVHGLDQPKAKPVVAYAEHKTDYLYRDVVPEIDRNSINFNNDEIQENGQLNERALRYKGNSIPSKSFRLLQNMTEGDVPIPLPHGMPVVTPDEDDDYKVQNRRRGPNPHRINLRQEPTPESQQQFPANHYSKPPNRCEPEEPVAEEAAGLQHLRYVGNSIPCKSFRYLQNIVGENNDDSDNQSPSRPPTRQIKHMRIKKAPSQEIEATDF